MNHETITLIALGILLFGLVSKRLQMSIITPPMAFTVLGLGLAGFGLLAFDIESPWLETLTEFTLVIVLIYRCYTH